MAEPNVLTAAQERTLSSVLDVVIPPTGDGKLRGAGQLGVGCYIGEVLKKMPALQPVFREGLDAVDKLAGERGAAEFAALPSEDQLAILMAQPFVHLLAFHAFAAYYQHPSVLEALGVPPRPPHPKGYELGPNDLSLVEAVRKRGPRYRTV